MTGERVGVVVAAYQARDLVADTMASLLAQTHRDWTCVVVDDGSTDDTAEAVRAAVGGDPRVRVLSQDNRGVSAARNLALAELPDDTDLVAFLDADDAWTPTALEVLVRALRARPDAVGAYGYAEYVDRTGRVMMPGAHREVQRVRRVLSGRRLVDLPESADATFDVLHVAGPIWPSAVGLHRLQAVRRAGSFDATFRNQGDWDLYVRMSRLGPWVVVPEVVAWYRRHTDNLTADHGATSYHHDRVRHKTWTSPDNTSRQRRDVARAWRYQQVAQTRRAALAARGALLAGDLRAVVQSVAAASVQLRQAVRPGPPPARPWRSRLLHAPAAHLGQRGAQPARPRRT